ncbi:hypothetical protein QC763_0094590 [Podospora pseudopauciseta]|uniref:Uncharacterized protein n=1 Tax=Podospora pseudopauciseta TaxID=2093780 RepID=A0ABR0H577_9PEZI|nr:hypothetical protein QC763_0094590 [Podospora pseudopauciseta]
MIRYHLLYKPPGVPLGLLGAGSASKELRGIWRMDYGTPTKLVVFVIFLLVCLVANLAGPSSAVLMIPQSHTWTVVPPEIYTETRATS